MKLRILFLLAAIGLTLTGYAEEASRAGGIRLEGEYSEVKEFLEKKEQNTISLAGSETAQIQATGIKHRVKIKGKGTDPVGALQDQAEALEAFLGLLNAYEVTRDQLIIPEFVDFREVERADSMSNSRDWEASGIVTITLQDQKQLAQVIMAVNSFDQASTDRIYYDHEQLRNIAKQVVVTACRDALRRAELYEEQLGLQLKPIGFVEMEAPATDEFLPSALITLTSRVMVKFEVTQAPKEPASPPPAPEAED